jgi:CheY-like chemotaxis protein/HPt (histidine-containing phosphotransfer) domain-containing protein
VNQGFCLLDDDELLFTSLQITLRNPWTGKKYDKNQPVMRKGFLVLESSCVMTVIEAERIEKSKDHPLKILVVDDDDLNRRMMRLLLVRDGHDVQVVANGVEALDAIKEQRFDVVFMDLQMPIMDGYESSRRIREWENGNFHTYIVALTASYLPEDGHLLFDAGIDNFISKPFEVDHIKQLLNIIARSEQLPPALVHARVNGNSDKETVLDTEKGIHQVGGDLKTYRELLADFIQELPTRIGVLEQLFQERDAATMAREAHNLKGVSSNLGAMQLAECAAKLDKQSNEGYTDQNQTLIQDIKNAESRLQKIATDFLNRNQTIGASA